jgi:2-haloacid dehalogenase
MISLKPTLFTFDIFGTVIDWRGGLKRDVAKVGRKVEDADFDRLIDLQADLEQERFRSYREITALSLVALCGLDRATADDIGAKVGFWPLYPDVPEGMARLQSQAACCAMTNSDRSHGEQAQDQLGFRLNHWIPAEEVKVYKPNPHFWHAVAERLGRPFGKDWWHVSAYADYDLEVAQNLGLTTVFVDRPHARVGVADLEVKNLIELSQIVAGMS